MKRVIYVLSEEINLDEWWGIYRWKGEVFYKKTPLMGILTVGDVFCKFFWLKTLQ